MNTAPTRHILKRRELVALAHPTGFIVECLEGELWVTADGAAGDTILRPGERLRLADSPKVVVSALRPAVLTARPCHGNAPIRQLASVCATLLADRIRRWRHAPLASYPVIRLR